MVKWGKWGFFAEGFMKVKIWGSGLKTIFFHDNNRVFWRIFDEDISGKDPFGQVKQQGLKNSQFFLKLVSWRLKDLF